MGDIRTRFTAEVSNKDPPAQIVQCTSILNLRSLEKFQCVMWIMDTFNA